MPRIYDEPTFIVFIAIGILQALIAWDSGWLAVKGIEDKLTNRFSLFQKGAFIVAGVLLFLLTVGIGYLNDKNQHQTEEQANRRATAAETRETQASKAAEKRETKLQGSLDSQNQNIGVLAAGIGKADASARRGDFQVVLSQLGDLKRVLVTAQPPQTSPSSLSDPASFRNLNARLSLAVIGFKRLDTVRQSVLRNALSVSLNGGGGDVPIDAQKMIKRANEDNVEQFRNVITGAGPTRDDVIKKLQLNPAQLGEDYARFNQLLTAAQDESPVPKTIAELLRMNPDKYNDLEVYYSELKGRLASKQP